jgi:hypothetical protein
MDANRLSEIAAQLAARVREDDPEANGRWLAAVLPEKTDWFRLAFVLAAAVPDDRTWTELTAWHTGNSDPIQLRRQQWRDAQRKRKGRAA